MKRCPNCNAALEDNAQFCSVCGAPQPQGTPPAPQSPTSPIPARAEVPPETQSSAPAQNSAIPSEYHSPMQGSEPPQAPLNPQPVPPPRPPHNRGVIVGVIILIALALILVFTMASCTLNLGHTAFSYADRFDDFRNGDWFDNYDDDIFGGSDNGFGGKSDSDRSDDGFGNYEGDNEGSYESGGDYFGDDGTDDDALPDSADDDTLYQIPTQVFGVWSANDSSGLSLSMFSYDETDLTTGMYIEQGVVSGYPYTELGEFYMKDVTDLWQQMESEGGYMAFDHNLISSGYTPYILDFSPTDPVSTNEHYVYLYLRAGEKNSFVLYDDGTVPPFPKGNTTMNRVTQ